MNNMLLEELSVSRGYYWTIICLGLWLVESNYSSLKKKQGKGGFTLILKSTNFILEIKYSNKKLLDWVLDFFSLSVIF